MARNSGQPRRNNRPNSVKLLQRLENGLDAFMDASVDAFLLFDDNLDLMSINPAGERLFGVSKEMVVGKNIVELEPGIKETGKYDKYLDVMKTGELFFVEEPFSHPKFGDMHLSIKAFKMRKGLGMIVNDITERRQMEEALRESELLATATIEGMSDGVVLVGMDGKVAYINKAFEKMLGYKLEELVGTSAVELPTYHGSKDKKKARQALKMVIEKGSAEPIDMVALTKDGVEIPINFTASVVRDAEGNPKTLVAVIRDVTERKKAEDALRRSEEHFRALVENSHEAVVVLKGDGTISFGTTTIERMLGYTSEDLLGTGGFGFAHPDDMPKVMESFTHLMENPSSVVHIELRIQHKDGSWRIVEAVARNLLENKAVEGIVINWRDITERKKAEEELRESEAKLKLYLDNSPDAIYILDAMGNFLYGNIAAEKAVGYSREEILGRSFVELSLLSDVQLLKAAQLHELNLAGKPTGPQEYELTRKDGSRVFVEISTYPVGKGDNLEVIGIARDITERRRMEEALRESELLATATIEGMSDGVVLVGMDGKVAYINKAFEKMLGYKLEELVGTSAVELPTYHGSKDKKKARQALKMVIEKGSAEPIDMVALTKDGVEIPINFTASVVRDAEGNPKTLVAVIRDVTERRWAEEALRESEKRLSDIAENSQEWIWEADTKGKYTYSSPIVESILGYTSEEILEKHFYDLFHPDDRENLKQVALEAFARKESFHEFVNRNVSKDGKTVWLSTSGIPLLDNAGNLMGYRGSDVDITERKKAEEALKESEERYRRLVDNAQDIIFRFSADKGLEYVSPAVSTIMGYSAEELRGNPELAFGLATAKDEKLAKDYQEVISEGKSMRTRDITAIRKDGKQVYLDMRSQAVRDKDGNVVAFEGILRDITERRKMEEEVRLLSDAVRMTTDSIAITDISGRVLDINEAGLRMYGLSDRADFVGKNPLDAIAPEDRRKAIENMAKIMETGQVKGIEYHVLRKDGSRILIETSVSLIKDYEGKPKGLVAVARDITERKRMEEALQQSELNYRVLFDSTLDGLFVIDSETMKVVLANESGMRMAKIYGFDSLTDLNIADMVEFFHPDDRDRVIKTIAEDMFEKDLRQINEFRMLTKDGREMWISAVGTRTKYQGKLSGLVSMRDITKRRKMEEELRLLSDAVKMTTDSVAVADMRGRILNINEAGLRMYGLSDRADFVGKNPIDAIAPEDRLKAIENMAKIIETGQVNDIEYHVLRKDGSRILIETSVSVIRGGNGEPRGLVAVARDITERKRAGEALRQSEKKYRQLFESMQEGLWLIDKDSITTFVNPRMAEILGYTAEEMLGKHLFEFTDERGIEAAKYGLERRRQGIREQHDFEFIRKDGARVYASLETSPITDEAGNYVGALACVADITGRKQAEEALKLSEERYRLLVDNASEAIVVAQDGILKFFNTRAMEILGYSHEELALKPFIEVVHPDDQQMVAGRYMARLRGEESPSIYSFRVVDKAGNFRWAEINAVVIDWEGRPATLNFLTDITERKKAEEGIERSYEIQSILNNLLRTSLTGISLEEQLQLFLEHIVSIDSFGLKAKGSVFLVEGDPGVLVLKAHKGLAEPLLAMCARVPFGWCLCGRAALSGEAQFADCLDERHENRYEGITQHGHYCVPILSAGKVLGVVNLYVGEGHTRDEMEEGFIRAVSDVIAGIIQRKKGEESLKESEERYRRLVDNAQDIVFRFSADKGLEYVSPAVTAITGYTPEELMADPKLGLGLATAKDEKLATDYEKVMTEGLSLRTRELTSISKDGRQIYLDMRSQAVRDTDGNVVAFEGILRDVTESRKAEEAKRKMEEQLRLAGRLAAVGELAAGVAHELNNPLAAIQGYSQFLSSSSNLDVDTRKDVETIYREALRASKITQNLLSFARRHEPEKKFISLNEVIENTIELRAHPLKVGNIELRAELNPDLPKTMADFYQLQQVFVNIINNAEQAMAAAHGKGKLVIKTQKSNGMIQVTFTDDGPGISEENLKRIFDPFFTTKEVGKGTGLGLSICYGIVEAHGGRVYAKSKLGTGATFIVEIPILIDAESK